MMSRSMVRMVLAVLLAATSACGVGSVTEIGGTTPADTTKPPTTVQRATIAVTVSFDPADSSVASTAGLSLSGLTVRLTRDAPGFTPLTATTDANGVARFPALLDGIYQVSVDRPLTTAESAKLSPADREASIFAGGATAVLSPPVNAAATVSLVAARRGSLVISEVFAFNNPLTTSFGYNWGTYIELYNNADTTIYARRRRDFQNAARPARWMARVSLRSVQPRATTRFHIDLCVFNDSPVSRKRT